AAAVEVPARRGYALAARAHVAAMEGDHRAAQRLYRSAARVFSSAGMVHMQALTLLANAASLTATGAHAQAESTRMLAEELARRSGAAVISHLARCPEAPAPGQAPGAAVAARLSLLTSREREIAEIAGRGKRTREIAEELSLSPRTVDVHLSRIYRKLDIPSRTALVRLMAGLV
ncbi:MAG TPA: helix-turn-helix transcriptional regulator, partial [Thermomonospora sp.]|nr:helix-turn-helix transcriptional regulator [Thermomonospora sp.]